MAWWGKLVGGTLGFVLGGPLGGLLGGVLGHKLDGWSSRTPERSAEALPPGERERVQTAFFVATFSVMGHITKADGRVSSREIALAEAIMAQMELSPEMRVAAIQLFQQGKAPDFDLEAVLEQFRRECHRRYTLIQIFLEIQIQAAYADGPPNPQEERLLLRICDQFGIPHLLYRQLERLVRFQQESSGTRAQGERPLEAHRPTREQAYQILGVTPAATDAEVKRAYRRLLSQHHPDKLVSKGLPEEMMKLAAQKTHEIRQAYEAILQARNGKT